MEHPGALRGSPVDWSRLRRILVVRADNLGDVLMAGPALRALRQAAPGARLHLLTAPAGAPAAALLPEVDDSLVASVSWQYAGAGEVPLADDEELVRRLRAGRFDAAVILTSFSQSPWPAGYLCRAAGIPVRAAMSKEFGGAGLTHWVPSPPDDLHQVDRALYLLGRLGVPATDTGLRVRLPQEARAKAASVLGEHGLGGDARFAVVLPGASCSSRRYPPERFAVVVRLLATAGVVPVVAGTSTEAGLVEEVAGRVPEAVALTGALDVPALGAALESSRVVVCNNSGGMHLADAVGAPVVALFSGTEEIGQFRPRSTAATVLNVPTLCSPCRQFTCPYSLECLDLDPAAVAAEALALATAAEPDGRQREGQSRTTS